MSNSEEVMWRALIALTGIFFIFAFFTVIVRAIPSDRVELVKQCDERYRVIKFRGDFYLEFYSCQDDCRWRQIYFAENEAEVMQLCK